MLSIRDKKAGLDVVIEPLDPAVQKAVQKLKTMKRKDGKGYFDFVSKIIVHHGGGSGELGHVESGPGKDPHEIHIFKDRIDFIVKNQFRDQKDPKALQDSIEMALIETIAHEAEHIGAQTGDNIHFKTEPEAYAAGTRAVEQAKHMFTDDVILSASLVLDDIRRKFFPNRPMPEPNLSFITRVALNDKKKIIKEAIELIESDDISPAYFDIEEAIQFNEKVVKLPNVIKVLSIIKDKVRQDDFMSPDFVTSLATLQGWMGLEPNGKLDKITVSKFSPATKNIPRNFGVVVPGRIYRGGIIEHKNQLKILKEIFGVKRVISLHESRRIKRMCLDLGIEFVPKYMDSDNFKKEDFEDVTKTLDEKPVYVHCLYGQDRTGAVIARYRIENGWPCQLAYAEAKAYGFQDKFPDMIDWFCEPAKDDPPVNTDKIRKILSNEQKAFDGIPENMKLKKMIQPTPNDMPFSSPFTDPSNYLTWSDTINNINPSMSLTTPILGPESTASSKVYLSKRSYLNKLNEPEDIFRDVEDEEQEILSKINGLEGDPKTELAGNGGISVEPFFAEKIIS